MSAEETLDILAAMRHQEDNGYAVCDWIMLDAYDRMPMDTGSAMRVDRYFRSEMTAWCLRVVDFCKLNRKTVEITVSLSDRFLATPEGAMARHNRSAFQLVFIASFYTAIKLHETKSISPEQVARFSNGVFTADNVQTMELALLDALKWRLNPPTSVDFVCKLMDLIPKEVMNDKMRRAALELTLLQTEMAVSDYDFVAVNASTRAYASIMNSLESLRLHEAVLGDVGYSLAQALGIDCNADDVIHVQTALYYLVANEQQSPFSCSLSGSKPAETKSITSDHSVSSPHSPRSVSHIQ